MFCEFWSIFASMIFYVKRSIDISWYTCKIKLLIYPWKSIFSSLVDGTVDSWVLDSGASFHIIAHYKIMENYIAGNYGRCILLMENL